MKGLTDYRCFTNVANKPVSDVLLINRSITGYYRGNYNIGHLTDQIACLSDHNEVWSDRLSDQE